MRSLIRNQGGVTLIELLISAVILGGLAYSMVMISQLTSSSTTRQEFRNDLTQTINEINAHLTDPQKCTLTFESTLEPDSIVNGVDKDTSTNPITYSKEKESYFLKSTAKGKSGYGNSKLKILSYELKEDGTDDVLEIKIQNKKSSTTISPTQTELIRKLNMYVEWKDPSDKSLGVSRCRSLLASNTLIWSRGLGDDIYYAGGKVIIGRSDMPNPPSGDPSAPVLNEEDLPNLFVLGDTYVTDTIKAGSFMYESDSRFKKNIKKISSPIEKIKNLEGVKFHWKNNGEEDVGFIAQNVQRVLPEIVGSKTEKGTLTVDYVKIVPVLVEALKKQNEQISKLQKSIEFLEQSKGLQGSRK
ncbi:MAG: tail fiber domain-containing protein [Bacteriovoracaceae bacterium]